MEKRPIPELLSELQPEHAKAALIEYNKPENVEWRAKAETDQFSTNFQNALIFGFKWDKSEQGRAYWLDILSLLERGTYIFPAKEDTQDKLWKHVIEVISDGGRIVDGEWVKPDEYLKSKYKITRIQ